MHCSLRLANSVLSRTYHPVPLNMQTLSGQKLSRGTLLCMCLWEKEIIFCVSHSINSAIQVHLIDLSLSWPSKAPLSLPSLPQKKSLQFLPIEPLIAHTYTHPSPTKWYTQDGSTPHKTALTLHWNLLSKTVSPHQYCVTIQCVNALVLRKPFICLFWI